MIVHFIVNKGGGSATSAMNYMLGADRDREGARVLQGNPELTVAIAENLSFKHKYTVGVLSFEEKNIDEKAKKEIMQSFEETLLAGLDKEQYNITWIEHTDKDRLELNFVIPKVDLHSGKAMNPYFHATDKDLVNAWKDTVNFDYKLTDPNDPSKKQNHVIAKNLPKDAKELSKAIEQSVKTVLQDELNYLGEGQELTRDFVINHLKDELNLEVARVTPTSISIKDPNGQRNIRLRGDFYEQSFRFSERNREEYGAEKRATQSHEGATASRIDGTRRELQELIREKHEFNTGKYNNSNEQGKGIVKQIDDHSRNHKQASNTADNRVKGGIEPFANHSRNIDKSGITADRQDTEQDRARSGGIGAGTGQFRQLEREAGERQNQGGKSQSVAILPTDSTSGSLDSLNWGKLVARSVDTEQTARTSRDTAEHRANATTSSSIGESGNNSKRRQINLDNSQERQEIQSRNGNKQQQAEFKTGIKPRFENPFNKDGGGEQLQHTELLKHPQAQQEQLSDHEQSTSSRLRELINTARNIANYCYRTYSEFRERIAGGDAIKSDAKQRESDTAGVNQQVKQRESNIEQHKSGATGANNWLEQADFALDNTDREIDEIKQGVISADARIRGRIEPQQLEKQVKNMESRGMER